MVLDAIGLGSIALVGSLCLYHFFKEFHVASSKRSKVAIIAWGGLVVVLLTSATFSVIQAL